MFPLLPENQTLTMKNNISEGQLTLLSFKLIRQLPHDPLGSLRLLSEGISQSFLFELNGHSHGRKLLWDSIEFTLTHDDFVTSIETRIK